MNDTLCRPREHSVLDLWHERHVAGHVRHLGELAEQAGGARERLEAVLEAYAFIARHRGHDGSDLTAFRHRRDHVSRAHKQLHDIVRDLLAEAAEAGDVRNHVAPEELAT